MAISLGLETKPFSVVNLVGDTTGEMIRDIAAGVVGASVIVVSLRDSISYLFHGLIL